jgi:hypothetical protein
MVAVLALLLAVQVSAVFAATLTPITGFVNVPENSMAAGTLATTGGTGPYTFALQGVTGSTVCTAANSADNGKFTIAVADLAFKAAPNFEAPGSAAGTNAYSICVRATDATPVTPNSLDQAITINVTNVNEAPVMTVTSGGTIVENATAWTTAPVVSASDPDAGDTAKLAWSKGTTVTATKGVATVSGTGATPTITYAPTANTTGSDSFSVKVSDGTLTDERTVNVTIVPIAPTAITGAKANVPENTTDAGTLAASGGTAPYTFALVDGTTTPASTVCVAADYANDISFKITGAALAFKVAPVFSATPANNTYNICVRATGTGTATPAYLDAKIIVNVTEINKVPSFTITPATIITVAENSGAYAPATNPLATAISDGNTVSQVMHFNVTVPTASQALFTVSGQPAIDATTGKLTFTPATNANTLAGGPVTVTVTLTDDASINTTAALTTAAQTFKITITEVNQPPTYTLATPTISFPCDLTSYNATIATDISAGAANESGQTLTWTASVPTLNQTLFSVQPAIVTTGTTAKLSFTPAANLCTTLAGAPVAFTLSAILTDNGTTNSVADAKFVSHDVAFTFEPVFSISGTITPPAGFGLLAGGTTVSFGTYIGSVDLLTGNYTISGIPSGSAAVAITPAALGGGYTFTYTGAGTNPPSAPITANLTAQNFSAVGTRTISGTITGPNGARLPAGTKVNFSTTETALSFTAPANGTSATTAFTITGLPPKNFILKPVIATGAAPILGGVLSPAVVVASTGFGDDTVGNAFTFAWTPYTLSGTILTPAGKKPLGKVISVSLVGAPVTGTPGFVGTNYTGSYNASTGVYSVVAPYTKMTGTNDPAPFVGNLVITGVGYQTFLPLGSFTMSSTPQTNNVTAYGDRTIFGQLTGATVPDGTSISFGPGMTAVVDSGYFVLPYLERASYTLTPTADGFYFTKAVNSFTQLKLSVNVSAADANLSGKIYAFALPKLVSPANKAAVTTTPTLTWQPVVGATGYNVEVSTSSSFTGATIIPLGAVQSYAVTPALTANTTYYWRVQANTGTVLVPVLTQWTSQFSDFKWSFKTSK